MLKEFIVLIAASTTVSSATETHRVPFVKVGTILQLIIKSASSVQHQAAQSVLTIISAQDASMDIPLIQKLESALFVNILV